MRLTKAWTAIDKLSIIWKSDLTDKMKRSFFQAAVVSILLYGCTIWTLTKRLEKKLDSNYIRMLRAILNKSWRQHPTKHQLYSHQPPITKTIQIRRSRHAGYCWRSRDELISEVLLWTPSYVRAKAGRSAWTYIQQLWEDTGCSPGDLPELMIVTKITELISYADNHYIYIERETLSGLLTIYMWTNWNIYIYIYIYVCMRVNLFQCLFQFQVCLHPVSELKLSCFYRASLWLRHFLWGDPMLEEFSLSSFCVWSQLEKSTNNSINSMFFDLNS